MCFHCKASWIMFRYKFLLLFFCFLFNCCIDIIKLTNTLINDFLNLCHQNFIIFSLVSHVVLITMKCKCLNMLDYLLTSINYTAIQTEKPKGQWNLISSQLMSPVYMNTKYLSRLFSVSPNFAVMQQY